MSNDPKEPLLLEHEYDGIQELDNKLPRWWVWLFYITIIFSAVYMVYYHVTRTGDLQAAEYANEMKIGEQIKNGAMGKFDRSGKPDATGRSNDIGSAQIGKLSGQCCFQATRARREEALHVRTASTRREALHPRVWAAPESH